MQVASVSKLSTCSWLPPQHRIGSEPSRVRALHALFAVIPRSRARDLRRHGQQDPRTRAPVPSAACTGATPATRHEGRPQGRHRDLSRVRTAGPLRSPTLSAEPEFIAKVGDVVGLYMSPRSLLAVKGVADRPPLLADAEAEPPSTPSSRGCPAIAHPLHISVGKAPRG
jgi:hypothetical protein